MSLALTTYLSFNYAEKVFILIIHGICFAIISQIFDKMKDI